MHHQEHTNSTQDMQSTDTETSPRTVRAQAPGRWRVRAAAQDSWRASVSTPPRPQPTCVFLFLLLPAPPASAHQPQPCHSLKLLQTHQRPRISLLPPQRSSTGAATETEDKVAARVRAEHVAHIAANHEQRAPLALPCRRAFDSHLTRDLRSRRRACLHTC